MKLRRPWLDYWNRYKDNVGLDQADTQWYRSQVVSSTGLCFSALWLHKYRKKERIGLICFIFVSGHKTNSLYVVSEHSPTFRCQMLRSALYLGYFSAPWCMLWHLYYRKQIKSTSWMQKHWLQYVWRPRCMWLGCETGACTRYWLGQKDKRWAPARAFRRLKV